MIKANKFLIVTLILLVQIISGCSKIDDTPNYSQQNFAIYFLKDPNIKIKDITTLELVNQDSQTLAKIELQKTPWLTDRDIKMYDFSSHLLYLESSKYNFLPKPVQLDVPSSWYNKPFMVVVDGARRYVGYFRGFFEDDAWPFPVIDCSYNFNYPEDLLVISWQWFNHEDEDNRSDDNVKKALNAANILHEGLELKLKDLKFLNNSDTATIEYTITLINNDVDNLYILDPYKMGTDLFHFFNIGPQFKKDDEIFVRSASLWKPKVIPGNEWDSKWFIKLNCKDSITRTIDLWGYPHFPAGNYFCEVTYQCIKKIPESQRNLSDGRYWIGPNKSTLMGLLVY